MAQVPPNSSNYYRPPAGPGPMQPGPGYVSIDAISAAWKVMQTDWTPWILASLMVLAMVFAVAIVLEPVENLIAYGAPLPPNTPGLPNGFYLKLLLGLPGNVISGTLQFILNAGLMEMGLRKMEGRPINAGDALIGFSRFSDMLVCGLVYALAYGWAPRFASFPA